MFKYIIYTFRKLVFKNISVSKILGNILKNPSALKYN